MDCESPECLNLYPPSILVTLDEIDLAHLKRSSDDNCSDNGSETHDYLDDDWCNKALGADEEIKTEPMSPHSSHSLPSIAGNPESSTTAPNASKPSPSQCDEVLDRSMPSDTKSVKILNKLVKRRKKPLYRTLPRYKELIDEYQASTSNAVALRKLRIFRKQDKEYPCEIKDTSETRFLANYAIRNAIFATDKNGKKMCPICDKATTDASTLKLHIFSHASNPIFRCEMCPRGFSLARYLWKHCRNDHKLNEFQYECTLCKSQLQSYRLLKQHMNSLHLRTKFCAACGKLFQREYHLKEHMWTVHQIGAKPDSNYGALLELNKHNITLFECFLCHKDYRERRHLRTHMRAHSQQPKLCLICGKQCRSSTSLHTHMQLHKANGVKSHFCDICSKGFILRKYLLLHRRKAHKLPSADKQPTCTICGQEFARQMDLYQHMKTHPFEQKRDFICSMCNYATDKAFSLQRHMETHSSERTFECHVCHKMYGQKYAQEHLRTHDKPLLECDVCKKRFKRAYALKLHSYQHGGSNMPGHQCDLCDKSFVRHDHLLRHRRTHDAAMNYYCKICNSGFITLKSLEIHERSHIKRTS